jgi:hypothetical protein
VILREERAATDRDDLSVHKRERMPRVAHSLAKPSRRGNRHYAQADRHRKQLLLAPRQGGPAERDTPVLGPLDAVGVQDANGGLNQIHRKVRRSIRV